MEKAEITALGFSSIAPKMARSASRFLGRFGSGSGFLMPSPLHVSPDGGHGRHVVFWFYWWRHPTYLNHLVNIGFQELANCVPTLEPFSVLPNFPRSNRVVHLLIAQCASGLGVEGHGGFIPTRVSTYEVEPALGEGAKVGGTSTWSLLYSDGYTYG